MNLVERAKNIMFNPKQEWEAIKAESITTKDLYTKYAMILAAIPAIAGFIGYTIFGLSWGFGTIRISVSTSILWGVITYITGLVGVYIISFIVDALAPSFGSTKDMTASTKVVVYSYTPAWVAGIVQIFPVLGFIVALASIYSLVLMYMGLQKVKAVPQDKLVVYFIVIIIVAIIVFFVMGAIVSAIAFSGYMMSGV
jgi:Yip1 domain